MTPPTRSDFDHRAPGVKSGADFKVTEAERHGALY
jgi:hypothetical protein